MCVSDENNLLVRIKMYTADVNGRSLNLFQLWLFVVCVVCVIIVGFIVCVFYWQVLEHIEVEVAQAILIVMIMKTTTCTNNHNIDT